MTGCRKQGTLDGGTTSSAQGTSVQAARKEGQRGWTSMDMDMGMGMGTGYGAWSRRGKTLLAP